jgi:hypothetical protein
MVVSYGEPATNLNCAMVRSLLSCAAPVSFRLSGRWRAVSPWHKATFLVHNDRQIHIRVNGTKDVVGASSSEWP